MKTVIFSDTHLHKEFEPKKYKFLQKIIEKADNVIIAGDFWESTLMSFDEFVNSPWHQLFSLLKKKKTVYIFGNHDKKSAADKRLQLFSDLQTNQYLFKSGKKTFIVEHGNKLSSKISEHPLVQPIRSLFYTKPFIIYIHTNLEKFLLASFGKGVLQFLFKRYNQKIKKTFKKDFVQNQILICGHTHAAEIDLSNNFVNTGIIRHGLGQYVVVDNGSVSLREEWYDKPF